MRGLALVLALALSGAAHAQTTFTLHLSTQATLPMGGYQLDGTARAPAVGYQVGATFLHLIINDQTYDLSANVATFAALGGTVSAGPVFTLGKSGALALGVGAAVDLLNGPEGRSVFNHFRWDKSFALLVSCSLPLPDFHPGDPKASLSTIIQDVTP